MQQNEAEINTFFNKQNWGNSAPPHLPLKNMNTFKMASFPKLIYRLKTFMRFPAVVTIIVEINKVSKVYTELQKSLKRQNAFEKE